MDKPTFFHTPEFNQWLIVSFFTVFVSVTLVILPALGLHRLGTAASDELSKYADPPSTHRIPTGRPSINPVRGIPVALNQKEQR